MRICELVPSSYSFSTEEDETGGGNAEGGTLEHEDTQDIPNVEASMVSSTIEELNVKDLDTSVSPVVGVTESGVDMNP